MIQFMCPICKSRVMISTGSLLGAMENRGVNVILIDPDCCPGKFVLLLNEEEVLRFIHWGLRDIYLRN